MPHSCPHSTPCSAHKALLLPGSPLPRSFVLLWRAAALLAARAVLLPRGGDLAGPRPRGATVVPTAPVGELAAFGAAVAQRHHRPVLVAAGQRVWQELLQRAALTLRANMQAKYYIVQLAQEMYGSTDFQSLQSKCLSGWVRRE